MIQPPMIVTDNSITVIHEGSAHTIGSGHLNWALARNAVVERDWEELVALLDIKHAIKTYTKGFYEVSETGATYKGEPISGVLEKRLISMMEEGADFDYLLNFHSRLQANPSKRAVDELYTFLEHQNIPIGADGCFYAYKGIRDDWTDVHSGKFINKPGCILSMPRNKVDDDKNRGCSHGFHVGSLQYAGSFGPRLVIVKVDPADVVSVPADCSFQKVRTCKYEVVSEYTGALPSTVYSEEDEDWYDEDDVELEEDFEEDDEDEDTEETNINPRGWDTDSW